MAAAASAPISGITARQVRLRFAPQGDQPLDWYNGDAALTEIFHALSIVFPAGETFFVKSVLNFAPVLRQDHPELWQQVQLFLRQEAAHTAVHEQWNERVEQDFGHPMREIDAAVEARLKRARRALPPLTQLAVTAVLEHWTSGLAFVLLGSEAGQSVLARSQEPYRSLWTWHALEELEHKKVAFDVYRAMGGGFVRRAVVMLLVSPGFVVRTVLVWIRFCRRRGLPIGASLRKLAHFMLVSPGVLTKFLPHWLAWFRPSFHPSMSDRAEAPVMRRFAKELEDKRCKEPRASGGEESDGRFLFAPETQQQQQQQQQHVVAKL